MTPSLLPVHQAMRKSRRAHPDEKYALLPNNCERMICFCQAREIRRSCAVVSSAVDVRSPERNPSLSRNPVDNSTQSHYISRREKRKSCPLRGARDSSKVIKETRLEREPHPPRRTAVCRAPTNQRPEGRLERQVRQSRVYAPGL